MVYDNSLYGNDPRVLIHQLDGHWRGSGNKEVFRYHAFNHVFPHFTTDVLETALKGAGYSPLHKKHIVYTTLEEAIAERHLLGQ